jgi:hypothetical protein
MCPFVLGEIPVVATQHILDVFGMHKHVEDEFADTRSNDVAVLACDSNREIKRIADDLPEIAE